MLNCFQLEAGKPQVTNCTELETNSTLFKRCLANFEDDTFDNYMTLFSQVNMICEFFNGTKPTIAPEFVMQVNFLYIEIQLYNFYFDSQRTQKKPLNKFGRIWKMYLCFVLLYQISCHCLGMRFNFYSSLFYIFYFQGAGKYSKRIMYFPVIVFGLCAF